MILLGVFRTPNMADVLLLADLSRCPAQYSAKSETAQLMNCVPSSAIISPMGGLSGVVLKGKVR